MQPAERPRATAPEALVVAFALLAYVAYASQATPRLTSTVHSDVDIAGWCGAIAAQVRPGHRLYTDFDVAMPPGGIALLAALQHVLGRVRLLDELWLIAALRVCLAAAAAWAVAPLTSRRTALLTAVSTLMLSIAWTPLSADRWLAALCVWSSFGCTVRSLAGDAARKATLLAGFFGGLTLAFDSSAALGVLAGWPVALLVQTAARRVEPRRALGWTLRWSGGVLVSLAATLGFALALGGTAQGFVRDVIVDGAVLVGRAGDTAAELVRIVLRAPAYPASMMFTALLVVVAARVRRSDDGRPLGPPAVSFRDVAVLALGLAATLGAASWLLLHGTSELPPKLGNYAHRVEQLPGLGIALGAAYVVARPAQSAAGGRDAGVVGAAETALIAAFTAAVVSAAAFQIGESALALSTLALAPLTPIGLAVAFSALERARLAALGPPLAVIASAVVYGPTLGRAVSAQRPVTSGYWDGLSVGVRGSELLDAAERVRSLAGPSGSVLVVPEDPALSALIGRPRPRLRGGLVFVDQYPRRLVAGDLAALRREPPSVIVVHPAERDDWHKLFGVRAETSGATRLCDAVLRELLPRSYQRDGQSFRTAYLWGQGRIELWVRR